MALLFLEGFDVYNTVDCATEMLQGRWTYCFTGTDNNVQCFAGGRTGYYVVLDNTARWIYKTFSSNYSTMIAGIALYPRSWDTYSVFAFKDGSSTVQTSFNFATGPVLQARRNTTGGGGTLLDSQSINIGLNAWIYLEMKVTFHTTTGVVVAKINGEEVMNATGLNTSQSTNNYANTIHLQGFSSGQGPLNDDLYVCDTSGSYNNDFLGDCKVETLRPDGAGNYAQWTPSAGSNYQNVDDNPGPDNDSTYNDGDTVNDIDSYTLDNLTTTAGTIHGVQSVIRASKTDAGTVKYKPLLRVNSTDYVGTEISPGSSYLYTQYINEINPNDSLAWEVADINAIEGGIQRTV